MHMPSVHSISTHLFIICLLAAVKVRTSSIDDFRRLDAEESQKLQNTCGTPRDSNSVLQRVKRISSGKKAKQGELPWAVFLTSVDQSGMVYDCTASIISRYHVITAAHCIGIYPEGINASNNKKRFIVTAGSPCAFNKFTDRFTSEDCRDTTFRTANDYKVKHIIIPERSVIAYLEEVQNISRMSMTYFDDIALLELEQPLDDDDHELKPICLTTNQAGLPEHLHIYGFGRTEVLLKNNSMRAMQLHVLEVRGDQVQKGCEAALGRGDPRCTNMEYVLIDFGSSSTLCEGDSGGGLSAVINGKHFLLGVLARATTYCEMPERLHIEPYYFESTKISAYNDFICFYAGVCALGFNVFEDQYYELHPEPVVFIGYENNIWHQDELVVPKRNFSNVVKKPSMSASSTTRRMNSLRARALLRRKQNVEKVH